MSWLTIYLITVAIAALAALAGIRSAVKQGKDITFGDLLVGVIAACFPVINIFLSIFVIAALLKEYDDYVIFKGKT